MKYGVAWFALAAIAKQVRAHGDGKCGTHPHEPVKAGIEETRLWNFKKEHAPGSPGGGRKLQYETCDELCVGCIEIPVVFHLTGVPDANTGEARIPHPTSVADEYFFGFPETIDPSAWTTYEEMLPLLERQMEVLNEGFADTPFYFTLMNADPNIVVNPDWTRYPGEYGDEMSAEIGVPDLKVLNIYLSYSASSLDTPSFIIIIGFATFAGWQYEGQGDGIYLRYDALPGGGFSGSDEGYTMVHEAGKGTYTPRFSIPNSLLAY